MKKRIALIVSAICAIFVVAAPVRAADTQDFTVDSFTADYYLNRASDGVAQMSIDETIVATFPDFDQNHGILRAIPQSYESHDVELSVQHVQKADGSNWQYDTSTDNDNTVLKIGDPDVYVHGKQTYRITYTVRGVANDQQNDTNIFWNVNGDQWQQPFLAVTARLHVPQSLAGSIQADKTTCYAGASGSLASDCTVRTTDDNGGKLITVATTRQLQPGETLSFSTPVTAGTFAPYHMSDQKRQYIVMLTIIETLPTVIAAALVWWLWRRHGRDAKGKGVIVPQYLPPKEASVMASSAIVKERFVPAAISATIIDLAVRHYIKVYETGKKFLGTYTYDLELVKAPTGLRFEELAVLQMIFGDKPATGTRIALASLNDKLYRQAQTVGRTVDTNLTEAGYFTQNPDKARVPYYIAGTVLTIISFVFIPYTLGLLGAAVICFIGSVVIAARTAKGAALKDYLLGLRDYMKLAEADRLKVLQSPRGDLTEKIDVGDKGKLVKLYERLLPYAMLFGIEKDWITQFADLYKEQPDWYNGTHAFSAVYFASAMGSFGTQTTQSFSPPSSSGGAGAGGGGGGGGGGGW